MLAKIAYFFNWLLILAGVIVLLPLIFPTDFWQAYYPYNTGFGILGLLALAPIFSLFALLLAIALQIKHLIITAACVTAIPLLLAAYLALFA